MQVRKLPVSQGLAWFRAAIDLGARNPRAVFGAALLFIAVLYMLAAVLGLVAAALGGGARSDGTMFLAVFVPLFIAMMVLMPILIGGLMHVIREAEAGRPVRARDLFAPFRTGRLKGLAALGALQIVLAILGGLLMIAVAGPDYWAQYMDMVRGAMGGALPVVPQPQHPFVLAVLQLAYNYFTYAIMLLAVPLVLFSGLSLMDAVRGSLRASVQNIGANLLAALLFVAGVLVAAIAVTLLALLVNFIGGLVHPIVGSVLALVIFLGFAAVLLVVLAGGAYLAWRDTFDTPQARTPGFTGIEA
ncbi:MAG TPA: BPSS1780 family membrane protein [Lysobacter sp.]|nr:BPSS1780 family membrane protein [Lysobacter sp.]